MTLLCSLLVVLKALDGVGLSEDDRVFGFEMGGVGGEGEGNSLARGGGADVVDAEIVLDISGR